MISYRVFGVKMNLKLIVTKPYNFQSYDTLSNKNFKYDQTYYIINSFDLSKSRHTDNQEALESTCVSQGDFPFSEEKGSVYGDIV